ncbi:hypothetical protein RRG08_027304 [Elysia crispata]|uniref:Uncharacterized protein n=1 Tax=Elysia crispata TaxID=231223 RepID=A0AAE0Z0S9_9GAST|nr:hypothetical protein RRG08_027304 [Elysia crispata]
MAKQGPLSKKDTPAFDPSTQARQSSHRRRLKRKAKWKETRVPQRVRPYSVAPRPAAAAPAPPKFENRQVRRRAGALLSKSLRPAQRLLHDLPAERTEASGPSVQRREPAQQLCRWIAGSRR